MKRKIIIFIGLALFTGLAVFNLHISNANAQNNEITLKNIEALATSSSEDLCEQYDCYEWRCSNDANYMRCYQSGDREACYYYTQCQY